VNPDKQPDLELELPAGEMLPFPDEPLSPEALYAWRLTRNLLWRERDPEGKERKAPVNVPFVFLD
jgi:hypothetical protein